MTIIKRLLAPFGALLALGSTSAQAREPQVARPALWEVSDANTRIYLFGTIHLLPQDLKWRTPAFDSAVSSAQQLVVETIVDQQNPQGIAAAEASLGFKQGLPPIAQRVPPAKLAKLRAAIAKSGAPEKVFDQMKTWLAAITLLSVQFKDMGLHGKDGPEEILRQQFLSAHKPIGELETNVEQFGYFDRMSEKAQRELLEGALEPQGSTDKEFDGMLSSWSKGDVNGIAVTFNRELSQSSEIRKLLLQQRNANWARWIEQRMAQPGTILLAVGAGHLAGADSVVEKLRLDGYKVRRVQ
ncbi:MAG TPA: TraB/GumN family protein [Sphingomicrobium sp.]|nr:TraB/GumN family protein [Sphingomicrobium sp.]